MKIYHNESLIAEYNGNGIKRTRLQRLKITAKRLLINLRNATAVLAILALSYGIGALTSPITTYATIEKIVPDATIPPVLLRIAKCESGNTHFDKSGQVLTRANTNRTVDTGKYQINTVWHAKATALGLDITKESDNEKMAVYIFDNFGSQPWYASANCWNK